MDRAHTESERNRAADCIGEAAFPKRDAERVEKPGNGDRHEHDTENDPAGSPSHADTPYPSSSAYSFCKEVPPMIPDRILLISTDSWSGGDGFHSPAHRVRPGPRGPCPADPPRPPPGDRRR